MTRYLETREIVIAIALAALAQVAAFAYVVA